MLATINDQCFYVLKINICIYMYIFIYYGQICMGSSININVCVHLYVHYIYYHMKLICVCTDSASDDWEGLITQSHLPTV